MAKSDKYKGIIELLCLDIDSIITKIQKNNLSYKLTQQEIELLLKKIDRHKNAELIHNNLYELNIINDTPKFLKDIYKKYAEYLAEKQKKVSQPENYNSSVVDYIITMQAESDARVSRAEAQVITAENKLKELVKLTERNTQKFNRKIDETKDKLITLTVTVLGIFCSLTFSLSGSLGLLNNVFNTNNSSFAESLFKFSLIGLFVSNLVFLLIYFIARINNKSLAMHCSKCFISHSRICEMCDVAKKQGSDFHYTVECHGCEHRYVSCSECIAAYRKSGNKGKPCWGGKLIHKFSYICVVNVVCLALLGTSAIMGFSGRTEFIFKQNYDNVSEQNQPTNESEVIIIPSDVNANVNVKVDKNDDMQQSELEQQNPVETNKKTNDESVIDNNQNTN